MGNRRYQTYGFVPVTAPPARRTLEAAVVDIAVGDFLHENTAGKATNATTSFAVTALGVAAAPCDNSPEASLKVEYYPLEPTTQYIVPVGDNLIATTDIGLIVNLNTTCNTILGTAITAGIGFMIDDIDVSANAVAANTYGYAIGHFVVTVAQS